MSRFRFWVDSISIALCENLDSAALERHAATTALRLKDLGVASAKLGDLSVVFGKLADGNISGAKIALAGINNGSYLADGVINRAALLASAIINDAKINDLSANKINAGSLAGISLLLNLNGYTSTIANGYEASYGAYAGLKVYANASTYQRSLVTAGGFAGLNSSDVRAFEAFTDGTNGGVIEAFSAAGAATAVLDGRAGTITANSGLKVGANQVVGPGEQP